MGAIGQRSLEWAYLGRVPYAEAVALQERIREGLAQRRGAEALLLLEHPHVYTLGRNADRAGVLADEARLRGLGVEVHECDRGGQVTYHGPGQLVGYPILNLAPDRRDLRRYVRDLQEVLVRTLAEFGISAAGRHEQPAIGVWAGTRKLASIGVHVSRWLTTHGFALNVSTDLTYFSGIVPCGLQGVEMASVQSLIGECPALPRVAALCANHFAAVFERRLTRLNARELAGACLTGC